ncbi:bifunctional lysylphosphatidylglycerol flippase/synthetase MprF [Geminicoccus roseus]|uniref:bifunctional lysylphosphatidylglycerol flippase/synthetase MprF n=1 Tax=Geminicoccus roseus TaxID=404900 RepID=UPI00041A57F3|nr:bifunctional lysylphosphatidylglycerol flippase/synthetase MprF [Geminicoccus roseus]
MSLVRTPQSPGAAVGTEEAPATNRAWLFYLKAMAPYVVGGVLFIVAITVLHRMVGSFHWRDVTEEIARIGWDRVILALGFTAFSFVTLVGYEIYGVRWAGKRLPLLHIATASFVTQSIAHCTGFAPFVGAGVRYRFYVSQGLGALDVAKVQAFFTFTFSIGVATLSGIILVATPETLGAATKIPTAVWFSIGCLLLIAVSGYIFWGWLKPRSIEVRGHRIEAPSPGITIIQICLGLLDLGAAATAFWVLLPPELGLSLPSAIAIFTAAIMVGVVSSVPGSLGVFEGAVMVLLHPSDDLVVAVLGALVLFRICYYLVPLLLGAAIMGGLEVARIRGWLGSVGQLTVRAVGPMAPTLFAILTGVAGVILLLSIATPARQVRLDQLASYLPLAVIELGHIWDSLMGAALLLVARGLYRRVQGAWLLAVLCLATGALASLAKGFDYEEAAYLVLVLVLLLPCRSEFYRRSSLLDERLSAGWLVAVAMVLAAMVWILFFAYRHVDYDHSLWASFALEAEVSRSMRGATVAVIAAALLGLAQLLRQPPAAPRPATAEELERARPIVARHGAASAMLVFTGDKALFFDRTGEAFIMYAVHGRSWVVMGEPVGPKERWAELLWDFHSQVDRHGGRTVFYQVGPDALPWLLDLGLRPVKIGESARIALAGFDLQGRHRAELRNVRNKAPRAGLTFELLPPARVEEELAELARVSDAWLGERKTREKRFSLGRFDPAYLAATPCAVVRQQGRIVAFANIWRSADDQEASIDLMRSEPDAPSGTMDYLIVETILWAKAQGFAWFDLGMAPLSGLPGHRLASLWSKFGRMAVRHGGRLYNFQGLRAFKSKFEPTWRPAYLLYPGISLGRVLPDITALIAGGWSGIVNR